jgi:hypothetical protein
MGASLIEISSKRLIRINAASGYEQTEVQKIEPQVAEKN